MPDKKGGGSPGGGGKGKGGSEKPSSSAASSRKKSTAATTKNSTSQSVGGGGNLPPAGDMFRQSEIVPDILEEPPEVTLKVLYKVKNDAVTVMPNQKLTANKTEYKPAVSFPTREKALYMLAMIDADVPSRDKPKLRERLHWLVANIPGGGDFLQIKKGHTYVDYAPPSPAKGTGVHRFVILLYEENMKSKQLASDFSKRNGFHIQHYTDRKEMYLKAGIVFLVSHDDHSSGKSKTKVAEKPSKK